MSINQIYESDIYPEVHYLVDAIRGFEEFASSVFYDDPSSSGRYDYLDGYLHDWLINGSGIERSGGDPNTWLKVVLHIADAVLKSPSILDYCSETDAAAEFRQRTIRGIFNPDGSGLEILDPGFYQVQRFRQLAGRSFLSVE